MKIIFFYFRGNETSELRIINEPLGLCYLASSLKVENPDLDIKIIGIQKSEEVLKSINEITPDLIGFSFVTYEVNKVERIVKHVKEKYRDILILLGGPHISFHLGSFDKIQADYCVRGEGEYVVNDLIKSLKKGEKDLYINGICYKRDNKVIDNGFANPIENLDLLPIPSREDLPMREYRYNILSHLPISKMKPARIIASRGCRYNCTFCCASKMFGKIRRRSLENIVKEIDYLKENFEINFIFVSDDDAFFDPYFLYELGKEMKKRNILWRSFCRVDDIIKNEELIEKLSKLNYSCTIIGLESLYDPHLKFIKKGTNYEKIKKALKILDKNDIFIRATYMVGYPYQTEEIIKWEFEELKKLPIDELFVSFLTPFPGTPLYDYCKRNNLLITEDFSFYDFENPVIKCKMESEKLKEYREKIRKEFYLSKEYKKRVERKINRNPNLEEVYKEFFNSLERIYKIKLSF